MESNGKPELSRRDVFLIGSAIAGAALAEPILRLVSSSADVESPKPNVTGISADASLPALPPLGVIALNRLGFGPRPGDIDAFNALPGSTPAAQLQAYVDQQLNPSAINDSVCDSHLAAANLVTLTKSLTDLWANYYVYPATVNNYDLRLPPIKDVTTAAIIRAVFSKRQLFELLVDFWHDHFNVFGWDYEYASATFVQYDRDVIRPNALGNFRKMLEAVGTSTAMLFYLNNNVSKASGPNENYAREMLELHTMGAENYLGTIPAGTVPLDTSGRPIGYVDDDVFAVARCFTGWRLNDTTWETGVLNNGTFLYYPSWHDNGAKTVLGASIPANQDLTVPMKDGRDVYDLVASHPATGRHIARKLCRRFISDNPPQTVVDAAAAVFTAQKDAPDQLSQVIRTIVLSPEFMSTWAQKVKRPFEVSMNILRATMVDFTFVPDAFFWTFNRMGQQLFAHHSPNGYSDVQQDWLGTMSILQRWALCNALLGGTINSNGVTWSVNPVSQMPATIVTPSDIADYWTNRILGRPLY
ncbi:MAG TPA: DUF1800 domain-containing protein, partial [Anaerolineae bacterium]